MAQGEPSDAAMIFSSGMAAGFRQRLERFETPAGDDCLRGQLLLAVPAGSRTGHAHVGFCPPFTGTPLVDASTDCDFVEAEVTAAEILPWGVRIECRLSEPAEEPLEIPVDISWPGTPAEPLRQTFMARWPTHVWTTLFTYGVIFIGFPLFCLLFWVWVRGG